MTVKTPK